jgi:hypothetical protein
MIFIKIVDVLRKLKNYLNFRKKYVSRHKASLNEMERLAPSSVS